MGIAKFLEKKIVKHLPSVARAVQRSMSDDKKIDLVMNEMRNDLEMVDSLFPYREKYAVNSKMPEKSMPKEEVLKQIKEMHAEESKPWKNGKISGLILSWRSRSLRFLERSFWLLLAGQFHSARCLSIADQVRR